MAVPIATQNMQSTTTFVNAKVTCTATFDNFDCNPNLPWPEHDRSTPIDNWDGVHMFLAVNSLMHWSFFSQLADYALQRSNPGVCVVAANLLNEVMQAIHCTVVMFSLPCCGTKNADRCHGQALSGSTRADLHPTTRMHDQTYVRIAVLAWIWSYQRCNFPGLAMTKDRCINDKGSVYSTGD